MQNRYFGDVGDFGKYGLLRALCGIHPAAEPSLSLGIAWYLHPGSGLSDDARHLAYLDQPQRFQSCDRDLYSWMKANVRPGNRSVGLLPGSGLFPATTVYCDASTALAKLKFNERPAARAAWLEATLAATADCDILYCDPDNGIGSEQRLLVSSNGGKFIGLDEIRAFRERDQTVVLFHHADHASRLPVQADYRAAELREATGATEIQSLAFHRGSARLYFILPAERHAELMQHRLAAFMRSPWSAHFTRF